MGIMYRGKMYSSKKELAEAYDVKPSTLLTRLHRGMSLDDALNVKLMKTYSPKVCVNTITFHNKEFSSLGDIADHYGVDKSIFLKICQKCRVDKGLDYCLDKAMKERGITYKRKHYNNYVELSADYGISKDNLMHRLYLGWSLEESLTRKVTKKQTKNSYTVRGITYNSKTEACVELGLDTCLVHRTWKYLGSSWEESVEFLLSFIERLGGNRPDIVSFIPVVIYNGVWCRDDKEFCKLCNVDYMSFKSFKLSHRLSNSYEVMKDYTSRGMYIYKYRGKEYNKTEIEKVKGIGHGTKPEVILRDREITRKYVLIEREHKFNPTGYCLYVKDIYLKELSKAKTI